MCWGLLNNMSHSICVVVYCRYNISTGDYPPFGTFSDQNEDV